jgi:hypothetical protein
MVKELKTGFLMMVAMTVVTGFIYPGVVTILSQTLFPAQANGSLIMLNGRTVGSRLIGQGFEARLLPSASVERGSRLRPHGQRRLEPGSDQREAVQRRDHHG